MTAIARSTFTGIARIPQTIITPFRARTIVGRRIGSKRSSPEGIPRQESIAAELQPISTIAKKMQIAASPKLKKTKVNNHFQPINRSVVTVFSCVVLKPRSIPQL